jgi:hypothetical protein
MRVSVPAPRAEWRDIVLADPNAQAFHFPEWVDGVCSAGPYEDVTRLYETADGRLLVMPMVRRSYLGGALAQQASLPPTWGIGGVLSKQPIQPEDIAAVYADLRQLRGVQRTLIQPSARSGPLWAAASMPGVKTVPRLAHVLDLSGGFDTVWNERFTKVARKGVRHAERSGLTIERDTTGALLPQFYALRQESVKRWARQMHEPLLMSRWRARGRDSLSKFQAMAAAMPTQFNLYLATHEGVAVAGLIVYHGPGARATSSAMIKELAAPVRANDLLHRIAIEDACTAGSTHFDFGESGASKELATFKTRYGARPHPYHQYVVERLPITEVDRALRTAVKRVIRFQEPGPVREDPSTTTSVRAAEGAAAEDSEGWRQATPTSS